MRYNKIPLNDPCMSIDIMNKLVVSCSADEHMATYGDSLYEPLFSFIQENYTACDVQRSL